MERIFAEDGGLYGELQGDFKACYRNIWLSNTVMLIFPNTESTTFFFYNFRLDW